MFAFSKGLGAQAARLACSHDALPFECGPQHSTHGHLQNWRPGYAAQLTSSRRTLCTGYGVGDLTFNQDGLVVTIRRSKTDQEGTGHQVGVPFGSDPATCPIRAVQKWIELAGIAEGALFRAVKKGGAITSRHLDPRDVARIVKRAAQAVGLDASNLAGHSLRSGLATAAAKSGKSERAIMQQGRWRSPMMARRYIREASLFENNAAAGIL